MSNVSVTLVVCLGLLLSACGAESGGASSPPTRDPGDQTTRDGSKSGPIPTSTKPPQPAQPAQATQPDTVQVFFATDRARFSPTAGWYARLFRGALVLLIGGWLVLRILKRVIRDEYQRAIKVLRVLWVLALLLLLFDTGHDALSTAQADARLGVLFGDGRARTVRHDADGGLDHVLTLGACQVSIPPSHTLGEVERPSKWSGDLFEDPMRHMVVLGVDVRSEALFFEDLDAVIQQSEAKDAFVFVHGFNVSFQEALLRTGQIAYDLEFKGAAICYSWPSQGDVAQYMIDEANVGWTVSHLRDFLLALRKQTRATRIHLIAHSMGNRALTGALARIALETRGEQPRFNEIVLAAPDIDAETFQQFIAPSILGAGRRVTLYASSNDAALLVSSELHGNPRAGETGDDIVLVEGMDTVDVSQVSGSHSYIGDSGRVLGDLGSLMRHSRRLIEGPGIKADWSGDLRYWILQKLVR